MCRADEDFAFDFEAGSSVSIFPALPLVFAAQQLSPAKRA